MDLFKDMPKGSDDLFARALAMAVSGLASSLLILGILPLTPSFAAQRPNLIAVDGRVAPDSLGSARSHNSAFRSVRNDALRFTMPINTLSSREPRFAMALPTSLP